MFRIFVERKAGFQIEAARIFSEITGFLGVSGVTAVRYLNRYDIENTTDEVSRAAATRIFSEPQSDFCAFESVEVASGDTLIVWEYLPGQYDQRADSAMQCLSLLREGLSGTVKVGTEPPQVRCAKMVILSGSVSAEELEKIQSYLINPVDSRLAALEIPQTLAMSVTEPGDVPVVEGFVKFGEAELDSYREKMGLAMDSADIKFLQDYFVRIGRDPTETEVRLLDTYWSDHCRHTTFNTELKEIEIESGPYKALFEQSLKNYHALRTELYSGREKPVTLMDMACIGAKCLKKRGLLDDIEISDEINACSIYIDVNFEGGSKERWLLMFKNETHNHPTEIEPFGGAATCIGGAIRDPLSGRSWVYQALRVSGAGDPTVPMAQTLKGKLPQIKLTREASAGFSSYGNQIGLTTGQVAEIYHPGFVAKRMELGAVIAAAPADLVMREEPEAGDIVVLVGGGTGRDGIGGATGSSKVHTVKSVTTAAAEVQKGNAVEERKIQRLFRNPEISRIIRRCNDFGAGGVAVAVGELAPGLDINLDSVPKKYEGLNGTELAISESQERMAIVVRASDAQKLLDAAAAENLRATVIATVTDSNRLVMRWRGKKIVDIERGFLDTAGARHEAKAKIASPEGESPLLNPLDSVSAELAKNSSIKKAWLSDMADLACCSQRGLCEKFDGSIGAATVLFPFGGTYQATPEAAMAAKIPVLAPKESSTASLMSFGYDPRVAQWSPWHGAQTAVLSSLAKILCTGGNPGAARLTFQEYFGRTTSADAWGKPAAALLGALDAQIAMGTASIGGKDSMSGTFQDMNVPPTLVSFAVATEEAKNIHGGSLSAAGRRLYLVKTPYSAELAPDFGAFAWNAKILYKMNSNSGLSAMYPVGAGGVAEAVAKMAFGNRVGFKFSSLPSGICGAKPELKNFFLPMYGSVLVETDAELEKEGFVSGTLEFLGETVAEQQIVIPQNLAGSETKIALAELESAWSATLAKVFPEVSGAKQEEALPEFAKRTHPSLDEARKSFEFKIGKAKPKVLLPVFPGTNCEYDMARAFGLAGAESEILVFCNNTPAALKDSLGRLQEAIGRAQILAFSGGFSAGDEPDGSGKFIANVIRERRVSDAVMELLERRDGLVLGICNGFQALIKTGLVPYGRILEPSEEMPTLTFNTLGRHVSRVARTRMVSAISPWARHPSVLDGRPHYVPVSHGEGRVIVSEALARELFSKGQVYSQYVDISGNPVMSEPDNPNGSSFAIEGITSPDGRVLGKMGHSERTIGSGAGGSSSDLIKNIAYNPAENPFGSSCQNLFAAGAGYFG